MFLPDVSRPILALLSLLLVAAAPEPGERAGDPGDASAEITVARGPIHRISLHDVAKVGVSGPAEITRPHALPPVVVAAVGDDVASRPLPLHGPRCCLPESRAPPAH